MYLTLRDLRHAWRRLRHRPLFTWSAVAVLALGIGSTTALATVARGVILDSLPFAVADRLVYMMETVIEYPHWLS